MGIGLGNPLTEFTPHLFLSDFEAMGAKRGVHRDSPFSTLPKARRVDELAKELHGVGEIDPVQVGHKEPPQKCIQGEVKTQG